MSDVLIHCAKYGYLEKVKDLVRAGADVNKKSGEERGTALYFAACYGHLEICEVLLENGADINASVRWGSTPLHAVCDRGHCQVLKLFISKNPDLDYQNKNGETCLHVAASRGYLELTRTLVGAGSELRLRNRRGKTAREEAEGKGHNQVSKFLAEAALKAPLPRRQKSDLKMSASGGRQKSFPYVSKQHPVFRSNPESSLYTGYSAESSAFTTTSDWTTDNNESLLSLPETYKSESYIPNIRPHTEGFRSLPENKSPYEPVGDIRPVGTKRPVYGYQPEGVRENISGLSNVSNDNLIHNVEQIVETLQIKLLEEREKNAKLQTEADMVPQLRATIYTLQQDNWALRKDFEHMKQQLELVAQQRDDAQMALAISRSKQTSKDAKEMKRQYAIDSVKDYSQHISTVDTDDFVICFEDNELHPNGDLAGQPASQISKSMYDDSKLPGQNKSVFSRRDNMSVSQPNVMDGKMSSPQLLGGDYLKHKAMADFGKTSLKTISNGKDCPRTDRDGQHTLSKDGHLDYAQTIMKAAPPTSLKSDKHGLLLHDNNYNSLKDLELKSCPDGQQEIATSDSTSSDKTTPVHHHQTRFPASIAASSGNAVYHALLSSFKDTPLEALEKIGESLMAEVSNLQTLVPSTVIDKTGKEWIPGQDFIVEDDVPMNCSQDGKNGSCSLVFRIRHKGQPYILKMMINLIDLLSSSHGQGQSLPSFLTKHFSPEYDIPLNLTPHTNIVRIHHHYNGATTSFHSFLKFVVPKDFDVPIEMANKTLFIVMDRYPLTLRHLAEKFYSNEQNNHPINNCDVLKMETQKVQYPGGQKSSASAPPCGKTAGTPGGIVTAAPGGQNFPEEFILLILYQLLSAVNHLLLHGVVHRDIKSDNIFLDRQLRVILGDFGFARKLFTQDGRDIVCVTSDQIIAGNSHAWAPELARLNRDGPSSLQKETLSEIYSKSDCFSIGRMFYSLLRQQALPDNFPSSSPTKPHYENNDIPELPSCYSTGLRNTLYRLVVDDPKDRLTCAEAMTRIGLLLFGPEQNDVSCEKDCIIWRHARMMSSVRRAKTTLPCSKMGLLTIAESIEAVKPEVERSYILNSKGEDIWAAHRWSLSV